MDTAWLKRVTTLAFKIPNTYTDKAKLTACYMGEIDLAKIEEARVSFACLLATHQRALPLSFKELGWTEFLTPTRTYTVKVFDRVEGTPSSKAFWAAFDAWYRQWYKHEEGEAEERKHRPRFHITQDDDLNRKQIESLGDTITVDTMTINVVFTAQLNEAH